MLQAIMMERKESAMDGVLRNRLDSLVNLQAGVKPDLAGDLRATIPNRR